MRSILLLAVLIGFLFAPSAYGEDKPFSGGVFLGGRALNIDHESANFNQYNAIGPGAFGGGNLAYDSESYHFLMDGAYLGSDDLWARLKGGNWGCYKFSLFYTEFPHNLSFKDRTIYTSPGSQELTFPGTAPGANPALWPSTSFDYKLRRKDFGGTFDLQSIRPFFFNLDANRLEKEGQVPWGAPSGLTAFGRTVEFPLPVDHTTTNVNATMGWKNKDYHLALSGGFSNFTDHDEYIHFRDPFVSAATATVVAPPDNKSWSGKLAGAAKLPIRSNFMVTASYAHNTSQTSLLNTIEGLSTPLVLSSRTFNGDIEYWNVSAALTSNPWRSLDTKIYYSYMDRQNNSDLVTFTDPSTRLSVASEIFSYSKNTIGGEASYRFWKNLKGILGYEFTDLRRHAQETEAEASEDPEIPEVRIPETWDHRITAQVVYNPLDWLGARLKYQKLYRGSHFDTAPGNPTNPNDMNAVLDNSTRRFNAANKRQDMFKGTFDLTPLPSLDVALEYAFKYDKYYKTVLGMNESNSDEFILDASYGFKGMNFFAFFDYETSRMKQTQRQVNPVAGASADPGAPPNVNSFDWNADLDNKNYAYGLGASLPIIKNRLSFAVQYEFEKNNGTADFTSQFLGSGLTQENIDIAPWDDYTKQSISAKLRYDVTGNLGIVFGYLYSQFKWKDGQFLGYRFVDPASGTATTYLTGAYTDQPYQVNLYYIKAVYRF